MSDQDQTKPIIDPKLFYDQLIVDPEIVKDMIETTAKQNAPLADALADLGPGPLPEPLPPVVLHRYPDVRDDDEEEDR